MAAPKKKSATATKTVRIDAELHGRLKERAARKRIPLQELVEPVLRELAK